MEQGALYNRGNYYLRQQADIWPIIEDDFKFAYDNLPVTQTLVGKANKWAAASYLAKVYMYQGKFANAKALYEVLITQGLTLNSKNYDLQPDYWKNFDVAFTNTNEAVFLNKQGPVVLLPPLLKLRTNWLIRMVAYRDAADFISHRKIL